MPVIDFHNHYYPPNYMKALQSGQSSVKVTIDSVTYEVTSNNLNVETPEISATPAIALPSAGRNRRISVAAARCAAPLSALMSLMVKLWPAR